MSNLLDKDYNKTGLKNIEERFLDIKQNNIDHEFSFEINKISNDYKVSLKKMLNLIYDNNIYKYDIEILIVTAIKNNDTDKFIENLKNFKEKYINKEDNLEIKEKFVNFYNSICNSIYNDNSEKNVINENMQSVIKNCLINPTRRK